MPIVQSSRIDPIAAPARTRCPQHIIANGNRYCATGASGTMTLIARI